MRSEALMEEVINKHPRLTDKEHEKLLLEIKRAVYHVTPNDFWYNFSKQRGTQIRYRCADPSCQIKKHTVKLMYLDAFKCIGGVKPAPRIRTSDSLEGSSSDNIVFKTELKQPKHKIAVKTQLPSGQPKKISLKTSYSSPQKELCTCSPARVDPDCPIHLGRVRGRTYNCDECNRMFCHHIDFVKHKAEQHNIPVDYAFSNDNLAEEEFSAEFTDSSSESSSSSEESEESQPCKKQKYDDDTPVDLHELREYIAQRLIGGKSFL